MEILFSSCPLLTISDTLYFWSVKSVKNCHLQPEGKVIALLVKLYKNAAIYVIFFVSVPILQV